MAGLPSMPPAREVGSHPSASGLGVCNQGHRNRPDRVPGDFYQRGAGRWTGVPRMWLLHGRVGRCSRYRWRMVILQSVGRMCAQLPAGLRGSSPPVAICSKAAVYRRRRSAARWQLRRRPSRGAAPPALVAVWFRMLVSRADRPATVAPGLRRIYRRYCANLSARKAERRRLSRVSSIAAGRIGRTCTQQHCCLPCRGASTHSGASRTMAQQAPLR